MALRNKREGDINGNWGRFYANDYYITLCVPQAIKNYECIRTVTKKFSFYKNRYDFLAAIIGHEYYHAWQWNHESDIYHCKEYLEVGAERYEEVALDLWVKYKEDNNWVDPLQADDSEEIGMVRYKDFRNRRG